MTSTTATDKASGGGHSHAKLYGITAVVLTLVTVVELVLLFIEPLKPVVAPILIVLSAGKMLGVIGIFMHLKDDRNIYRILFLAPMVIAVLMIIILAALAVRYYAPFGGGEVKLAVEKAAEPPKPPVNHPVAFKAAAVTEFADGKALFQTNCLACHGPTGGGLTGPNLTDDCTIHGPELENVVHTVNVGVPGKTMPAWGKVLPEEEVNQVSYYVHSLRGTNVAGGKPCEGAKAP